MMHCYKCLAFVLLLCFVLQTWGNEHHDADTIALSAEQRAWLDAHPDIVLGMSDQWPPALIRADDGQLSGIMIDALELLNQRLGTAIRVRSHADWPQLIEDARARRIDGLLAVAPLPMWDDAFLLTDPHYTTYLYIYTKDGNTLPGTGLEALAGQRVGWLRAFRSVDAALSAVADRIERVEFDTNEDLAVALLDGRIDLAVATGTFDWWRRQKSLIGFGSTGIVAGSETQFAMAIRQDWEPLVEILNLGLASITPTQWRAIFDRWTDQASLVKASPRLTLTPVERQWLIDHPVIRYTVQPNRAPVEFIDRAGGPSGMSAEYLERLSRLLGVRFEFVLVASWSEALEKVRGGEIDLLPTAALTPERETYLTFTEPYLHLPIAIFAPIDAPFYGTLEMLEGQRVAVLQRSAVQDLLDQSYPSLPQVEFVDTNAALRAIQRGEVDVLVESLLTVSYVISRDGLTNIRMAGNTPYSFDLRMAVRHELAPLAAILDQALAAIPQFEQDAIQSRWMRAPPPARMDYQLVWRVLGGSALVLILILLWNLMLGREIARRRRAEQKLAQSEQRYRGMVESGRSVLHFYSLDVRGVILDAGAGSRELFGIDERAMIGMNWHDIAAWSADTLARGQRALATCWLGQAPAPVTLHYELNGQARHLVSFPHPVVDDNDRVVRVDGLNVDLTERMRLEQEVRELESSFQALFEHSPLPMLIASGTEVRTLMVNQRFRDVVGYDVEDIPDVAHWWLLAYPDPAYRQQVQAQWQQRMVQVTARQNVIEPMEARVQCGDGQTRTFMGYAVSLDQRQLIMFVDVTEQRTTEARLRTAQENAEAANRAKSEFLANMSHEIRTPMNAVLGMQSLCLDGELNESKRDHLLMAQRAAKLLLGLLNDILDLSQIEAGQLKLDQQPFALAHVLDQVRDVTVPLAENKELSFIIECATDVPSTLYGDALRLGQILLNLANNAVKFTERGTIRISVRLLERLPADAAPPRERVHLEFRVQDTGIGLSEAQIAELFQPFHQADGSIARRYGGTGLGLSICKRLALMMGGAIGVDSRLGVGSTFWFTLWSQCTLPDEQPTSDGSVTLAQAPPALAGQRVLLVEDDPVNRIVARAMLERAGILVSEAENGVEALTYLRDQGCASVNLVLMDLQMPEMGGLEATQHIRQLPNGAKLPIIGLSAHVRDEDISGAHAAGMNAHLGKPFEVGRLYRLLAEQLGLTAPSDAPITSTSHMHEAPDVMNLSAIPGLDPDALHALGPKADIWLECLQRFAETHATTVARIDAALASGNREQAERTAHTLIGAAGLLGLTDIRTAARALETALRNPPSATAELAEARAQLTERLEPTLAAIDAWCKEYALRQRVATQPPVPVDHAYLAEALKQLLDLTQAYNPLAEDLWREQAAVFKAGIAPAIYQRLDRQISGYRFPEASTVLVQVRKELSHSAQISQRS